MAEGVIAGSVIIVVAAALGFLVRTMSRKPAVAQRAVQGVRNVLPYGDDICRGLVRCSSASVSLVMSLGVFILSGCLSVGPRGGLASGIFLDISKTSLFAVIAFFLVEILVVAFNWPKVFALSHMRSDEGLCKLLCAGVGRTSEGAGPIRSFRCRAVS